MSLFIDSGVHGALVVLEHSFSAETMATALGIPSSKTIIRRHLATEFENLIMPARYKLSFEKLKFGLYIFYHSNFYPNIVTNKKYSWVQFIIRYAIMG